MTSKLYKGTWNIQNAIKIRGKGDPETDHPSGDEVTGTETGLWALEHTQ